MSIPDMTTQPYMKIYAEKWESTLIAGGGTFHVSVVGFNGLVALSTKCKYLKPKLHIPPMSDCTKLCCPLLELGLIHNHNKGISDLYAIISTRSKGKSLFSTFLSVTFKAHTCYLLVQFEIKIERHAFPAFLNAVYLGIAL